MLYSFILYPSKYLMNYLAEVKQKNKNIQRISLSEHGPNILYAASTEFSHFFNLPYYLVSCLSLCITMQK